MPRFSKKRAPFKISMSLTLSSSDMPLKVAISLILPALADAPARGRPLGGRAPRRRRRNLRIRSSEIKVALECPGSGRQALRLGFQRFPRRFLSEPGGEASGARTLADQSRGPCSSRRASPAESVAEFPNLRLGPG